MIKNYFKIAWRNLWKNKIYSAINIIGLAVEVLAALIITCIAVGFQSIKAALANPVKSLRTE